MIKINNLFAEKKKEKRSFPKVTVMKKGFLFIFFMYFLLEISRHTTLLRRLFIVLTSFQRPYNVFLTSCASWDENTKEESYLCTWFLDILTNYNTVCCGYRNTTLVMKLSTNSKLTAETALGSSSFFEQLFSRTNHVLSIIYNVTRELMILGKCFLQVPHL